MYKKGDIVKILVPVWELRDFPDIGKISHISSMGEIGIEFEIASNWAVHETKELFFEEDEIELVRSV